MKIVKEDHLSVNAAFKIKNSEEPKMHQVQIYGENNQYVMIQLDKVHGFPEETCYSGGYDVEGTVTIKSGGYFVSGSLWISTGQLYLFKNQLKEIYDSCEGEVRLHNNEKEFEVSIKIDRRGRVVIEGRFKEFYGIDNELMYAFESDQSYILKTLKELDEIIKKYGDLKGIKII